jgi:hypothetical protein
MNDMGERRMRHRRCPDLFLNSRRAFVVRDCRGNRHQDEEAEEERCETSEAQHLLTVRMVVARSFRNALVLV